MLLPLHAQAVKVTTRIPLQLATLEKHGLGITALSVAAGMRVGQTRHLACNLIKVGLALQVKMTLLLALVSVPINTVWGIVAAIQITRNEFWGKTFVMAMLDLPFSISPVVTGTVVTTGHLGICTSCCCLPPACTT